MPDTNPDPIGARSAETQAPEWARCHSGIVFFGPLARVGLPAGNQSTGPLQPLGHPEAEGDLMESESPLLNLDDVPRVSADQGWRTSAVAQD
jgi:hypothetical protein